MLFGLTAEVTETVLEKIGLQLDRFGQYVRLDQIAQLPQLDEFTGDGLPQGPLWPSVVRLIGGICLWKAFGTR